jgi:DNA polymerase-3 subunit delta'
MNDIPAPRETLDLIGHEAAERQLLDVWSSGRFPHAWLITGLKGIGKATLAYRLARFVLAGGGGGGGLFGGPDSLSLPGDHPVVRRVASLGHADLAVIERAWADDRMSRRRSEIVIDDARGIGTFLSLTPAEGGWRVVIVDAACEMNRNAANALLKVLEEPPSNALIILVSHAPGRLLPTIRSRCRTLALRPLDDEALVNLLARHRPDLAEMDRLALSRLAEGSLGRALDLAAEGGLDLYRDLVALLLTLPNLDIPRLHVFADRVAKQGQDSSFRTVTTLFGWWLARMVRAGGTAGQGVAEVVPGESALIARLLAAASLEQWLEVWEKTSTLFVRTEAVHLDPKQIVIGAFLAVERLARQPTR